MLKVIGLPAVCDIMLKLSYDSIMWTALITC